MDVNLRGDLPPLTWNPPLLVAAATSHFRLVLSRRVGWTARFIIFLLCALFLNLLLLWSLDSRGLVGSPFFSLLCPLVSSLRAWSKPPLDTHRTVRDSITVLLHGRSRAEETMML